MSLLFGSIFGLYVLGCFWTMWVDIHCEMLVYMSIDSEVCEDKLIERFVGKNKEYTRIDIFESTLDKLVFGGFLKINSQRLLCRTTKNYSWMSSLMVTYKIIFGM